MSQTRTTPAVVFPKAEQIEIHEVPIPPLGPKDVLIRTTVTAISVGTELMVLRGSFPNQQYPCVVGYQNVGVVEDKGDEVTNLEVGARVVVQGGALPQGYHSGCGVAHIGHLVTKAESCVPLAEGVPDTTAVYGIMAAVGLLGCQFCHEPSGQTDGRCDRAGADRPVRRANLQTARQSRLYQRPAPDPRRAIG
jgi:2-desacetyl-2-hydroxyethyl bacteriochlorophyllide A dehydrogenase